VFAEVRSAVATLESVARELDPLHFDGPGAASLLADVARGERVCAAIKALLARRVDETGAWKKSGHSSAVHWLADTTGVSQPTARRVLETAHDLDALPSTSAAFRSGEISEAQAHLITGAARMDPSAESSLIATAAQQSTVKGLGDACAQVRATAQADDLQWARDQYLARSHRRWKDRDGMGCGQYRLPPDDAARLWRALDDHEAQIFKEARKGGRREPHEAYAADALVALAEQGPCKPVELKVSADGSGLARGYVVPGERCEIDGFGPIPVTIARSMLNDARITVIGKDGTDVRTITSPTRNVPAKLRRMLEDAFPTCGNQRCASSFTLEMDHIIPVADGGCTTFENMWRLCKACHKLKHLFGWKVVGPPGNRDLVPPDDPEPAWVPAPPAESERRWESSESDRALELVASGPSP
jgi:Domain of unknown function (DUF222)/HNH endonuclease